MAKYRVTIHEHFINDLWVEANSKNEAISIAEDHITEGYNGWVVDEMACWTEVGDVYNQDGEEV
jgi:hypothetical protein